MAAAAAAAVKRRQEVEAAIAAGEIHLPAQPIQPKGGKRRNSLPDEGAGFWKYQRQVAVAYMDVKSQLAVAVLISGNFLVNIVEKWIDPSGEVHADVWRGTDLFFNILFFIELMINMYGFWWVRFWTSAWNVFDFVVVSIGVLDVFQVQLPGPLSLLRMMRAFRVFRLFKRVQSLKKILDSLTKALPSHINSFGILLLVMCIYAILAVDFFMNYGGEGFYTTNLNDTIDATTTRGLSWGYDYYGNFGLSLFTMFQVITGDSWSEAVARPLVHGQDGVLAFGSAMYFISFQLVCGVVLINVTIAILLEKMVDDGSEKMEAAQQEAQRRLLEGIDLDKLPIEVLDGAISGSLTGDALGEAGEMLEMEGEVQQMRRADAESRGRTGPDGPRRRRQGFAGASERPERRSGDFTEARGPECH
ncbi:Voltage-dependent T-type calcium channel subunit alpha-1I (CaVT.3) (Voltage-gated calcium channel subunit alpha Cav3.3) [Durusdinium trenchii]|uniref:Voltage-dependent T-type calcium channel subunit alpha-1I (CaVT.3) (Voltage-gated calcium channel subunit alpha Cav3.3) n=1 Tax=Durusdinium trenchii TaxID=1381693 RepID=A0ABP0PUU9_9DINO